MTSETLAKPVKPSWNRHNITLDETSRANGEVMAKKDKRSFSNFIEWLIDMEWARRNALPAATEPAQSKTPEEANA